MVPTQPGRGQRVAASAGRVGGQRTGAQGGEDPRRVRRGVSLQRKQVLWGRCRGCAQVRNSRKRGQELTGWGLHGGERVDAPIFCFSAFSGFLPQASVTFTARKKKDPNGKPGRSGRSWRPDAVPHAHPGQTHGLADTRTPALDRRVWRTHLPCARGGPGRRGP